MHQIIRNSVIFGFASAFIISASGCAPQLETPNDSVVGDGGQEGDVEVDFSAGPVFHQDPGDGTTITHIKATDSLGWVYLDLESKAAVTPDDLATSLDWDMGFQRFSFKLNGGVSGSGDVAIAALPGESFDNVSVAPAAEYVTDLPDSPEDQGGDANEDPDYAFSTGDTQWFDYNSTNHVLTPLEIVYVLRSTENTYYKLEVLSYYSTKGESAYPSFRWQAIDPPPASIVDDNDNDNVNRGGGGGGESQ